MTLDGMTLDKITPLLISVEGQWSPGLIRDWHGLASAPEPFVSEAGVCDIGTLDYAIGVEQHAVAGFQINLGQGADQAGRGLVLSTRWPIKDGSPRAGSTWTRPGR